MNLFRSEKGVTLVELLAAITLLSVVIGLVVLLVQRSYEGFDTVTARQRAQEKARTITEHMVAKMREQPVAIKEEAGYVLVLESKADSASKVRYKFAKPNFTIETVSGNAVTNTLTIADNVESASVTVTQPNKIRVSLSFAIPQTKPYLYETVVYVPGWDQNPS